MTTTKPTPAIGLPRYEPRPSRSEFRHGTDGDAEHALACHMARVHNLGLDEMSSCAGMTPAKLAAIEAATGKPYTAEERAHILGWSQLARENAEFLARAGTANPEDRAEISRKHQAWIDGYMRGAADRETNRAYTKTYAAKHPDRVLLTNAKKNLKSILKSAERYRAAIAEFERIKALHEACDPGTFVERYATHEILAGGAKFEREHLAEAEVAIAKWHAEIARLEGIVAAEKASVKATKRAAKI